MKLSCLQENLKRGLAIVGGAVATRTTLPITNNILLATDHSRLKLVATDLEKAITCWIDAQVEEEGTITLPAKLLTEFVGQLDNDKVEITMGPKGNSVAIKCARYGATINGLDARDFPPISTIEQGTNISVETQSFKQAIAEVVFATSGEYSRPVLTGVGIKLDGNKMTLAGADGFRLAVCSLTLVKAVDQKVEAIIIPARTLKELGTLMGDGEELVQITINPNKSHVVFKLKDAELVSTLIAGAFPQYEALIPQKFTTKAVVDTATFLTAVKTASMFAREGSGITRLIVTPGGNLTPGRMTITGNSEDVGDNKSEIDAIVQGGDSRIGFNGKYVTEGLSVLKETQVSLEISGPSSPFVIRPVGVDNYTYTIMSMFVTW